MPRTLEPVEARPKGQIRSRQHSADCARRPSRLRVGGVAKSNACAPALAIRSVASRVCGVPPRGRGRVRNLRRGPAAAQVGRPVRAYRICSRRAPGWRGSTSGVAGSTT